MRRSCGRALAAPLPLAGEVAPKAWVRVLSPWGLSIVEAPSPQPSPASGGGSAPSSRKRLHPTSLTLNRIPP
ncbi:hypothetical protein SE91_00345 [Bradyrhizobium sp. DOA1]|nr:hypothetical protein SE91_00345 [Bradyrhizobium sp. DOA1]